jgi:phosphoglycerate dehydrogenase-like enzyme
MPKVVIVDADFELDLEREAFSRADIDMIRPRSAKRDDVMAAAADASGLLVQFASVDASLIAGSPTLKVIGRFGVGMDAIDIAAATERGIAVVNSGDYSTQEVAAHAVALAMVLLRRVLPGDRAVRAGLWTGPGSHLGIRRLTTLRVGVVGLGRIGRLVAEHLAALGLQVTGYDPQAVVTGVPRAASLDDLLRSSDLVTLHVPLSAGTRNLLDARRIALIPKGGLFVNTARGALVDETALVKALSEGHLAAAALDVFVDEPLRADHPLCELANVVLTPHVGYFSAESLIEARKRPVADVIAILAGGAALNLVNPEYARHRENSRR